MVKITLIKHLEFLGYTKVLSCIIPIATNPIYSYLHLESCTPAKLPYN